MPTVSVLSTRRTPSSSLRGVDTDKADSDGGFTVTPEYLGVRYSGTGGEGDAGDSRVGGEDGNPTQQAPKSAENEAHWGSFPSDFIDFQDETGQFSYWFSSGGQRDPFKPTEPMTIAYSDDFDAGPGSYSGEGAGGSASAGDSRLNGRTYVIAGLTAGAGLAATITSLVYFRRRLGLDPRMFL